MVGMDQDTHSSARHARRAIAGKPRCEWCRLAADDIVAPTVNRNMIGQRIDLPHAL
jgi:hypothetical protein